MMHAHNIALLIARFSHLSPWGVYLAIISSGHLVPVPEAVLLLVFGYLSAIGKVSFLVIVLASAAAAMTSDLVTYGIARGGTELAEKLAGKTSAHLLERYRNASHWKLFLLVLGSHFVPGLRFANPIVAGVIEMSAPRFALYTAVSCLIYIPIYVGLGYAFSDHIQQVVAFVSTFGRAALVIALAAALLYFVSALARSEHAKRL